MDILQSTKVSKEGKQYFDFRALHLLLLSCNLPYRINISKVCNVPLDMQWLEDKYMPIKSYKSFIDPS